MAVNHARRSFLRGRNPAPEAPCRLPWILGEQHFTAHCTGCGDCVTACSENVLVIGAGGLPEISFKNDECTFCGDCLESCKEPLFKEERTGKAWPSQLVITNGCLAKHQIYCQSCRDSCETEAIAFPLQKSAVPQPQVNQDACSGCGACVSSCPEQAISLKILLETLQ